MDIAIITVPYIKQDAHLHLAIDSYRSFKSKHNLIKVAVINHVRDDIDLNAVKKWNDKVIKNDKNILSRAWNKGIDVVKADYYLITNLDVTFKENYIDNLVKFAEENPKALIWSGYAILDKSMLHVMDETDTIEQFRNFEHNFAAFLISKKTIKAIAKYDRKGHDGSHKMGYFSEIFKPAYSEDCDYLRRAQFAGLKPLKTHTAYYWHYLQATTKHDEEERKKFDKYIKKVHGIYKKKWGGVPNQETFKTPYENSNR
jgi:GT2 family glycosyltransferase